MFLKPYLAVVRIEEHGYNIGQIEVSNLIILLQLQPANVEAYHEVGAARLAPSFFKVV